MRIRFNRAARIEQQAAYDHYEQEQLGLGDRFRKQLMGCIQGLSENPRQFPLVHGEYRRALLDQFPYQVFFYLKSDTIRILAIAHAKREPFYWQHRI